MYEKCIKCEHLGKDCIPNLYVMSITEIRDWARSIKEEKGWSNAHLAELSGVPKGTIDSNFSRHKEKCSDVNYSTFAPVLCALLECEKEEMPCSRFGDEYKEELKNEAIEELKEEYEERVAYFKEQMAWRKHIIIFLIILSCVLISFISVELAIDWNNSGLGFFWR